MIWDKNESFIAHDVKIYWIRYRQTAAADRKTTSFNPTLVSSSLGPRKTYVIQILFASKRPLPRLSGPGGKLNHIWFSFFNYAVVSLVGLLFHWLQIWGGPNPLLVFAITVSSQSCQQMKAGEISATKTAGNWNVVVKSWLSLHNSLFYTHSDVIKLWFHVWILSPASLFAWDYRRVNGV